MHSLKGSSWNVTRLLRKQYQFQYIYLLLIEKDIEAISINYFGVVVDDNEGKRSVMNI